MLSLMIRTDKPEAELYLVNEGRITAQIRWQAHRQLLESIHSTITTLLVDSGKSLNDLQGIVVFTGGGSFTGLRIGVTVANALSQGLAIPVVAAQGTDWIIDGEKLLHHAKTGKYVEPTYDRPATITEPIK